MSLKFETKFRAFTSHSSIVGVISSFSTRVDCFSNFYLLYFIRFHVFMDENLLELIIAISNFPALYTGMHSRALSKLERYSSKN